MREIDRRAIEEIGIPGMVLMENAGRAVCDWIVARHRERPIVVYCGGGNNGGDGFVIVRQLTEAGLWVIALSATEPERLRGDARTNKLILEKLGIDCVPITTDAEVDGALASLPRDACHVDALFGTGLTKPIRGHYARIVDAINRRNEPVVAVDVPSGVAADSGEILGSAVRAKATITFALPKLGLLLAPGCEHVGELIVADIGIPRLVVESTKLDNHWLREAESAAAVMPRETNTHKGSFGHVLIAAGSPGFSGAALLAGRGALAAGAGLVTVASEASCRARIEAMVPELLHATLFEVGATMRFERDLVQGKSAVVVGPGLGQSDAAREIVLDLLDGCEVPLVIDADGLNVLRHRLDRLAAAQGPVVLTPHPGEMGRLIGCSSAAVQAERYRVATELASTHGVIVVLKGNRTLIAAPDGRVSICTDGNPGMAVGGMGDVLAGVIGAGLGQYGGDPFEIVSRAVHLHALAGDRARERKGERSLLPSDVIADIAEVLRTWERA
ncbi:MAG: NAD(P)H-hydrate dehydratase [Myxococcales bacterium]|nr:NAD(P)H-hydrate dehydratase [Myxococcales bacterium]